MFLLTELADPQDVKNARFVEIYSPDCAGRPIPENLYLMRWTNGNANPTMRTVFKLADATENAIFPFDGFLVLCGRTEADTEYGVGTCDAVIGNDGPAYSDGAHVSRMHAL